MLVDENKRFSFVHQQLYIAALLSVSLEIVFSIVSENEYTIYTYINNELACVRRVKDAHGRWEAKREGSVRVGATLAFPVPSNFPSASITRRTHANLEPIVL